MNHDYDPDGLDSLVAAVAKQWLADCPAELALVCDWLGITSEEALRRQTDTGIVPTWTGATCVVCGRPVQRGRRGRQGKYCGARCKARYLKQQKERVMDFEEIEAARGKALETYEAQQAKVKADRYLSAEGQQKKLAELESVYRAQVGTAMERAAELIASEREAASKALKAAQTKAAAAERELIGPEIMAGFLRAEVTGVDGPDVLRMVENAPDDWSKAVILRAGLVELRAKARAEGAPSAALIRLEKLAANPETAKLEERLRLLATYEGKARQWDPDREKQLRQRFGL
jgi:hypothetical protein